MSDISEPQLCCHILEYAAGTKCIIIIYTRDYMVHDFGPGIGSMFEDSLFIAFERRDYMFSFVGNSEKKCVCWWCLSSYSVRLYPQRYAQIRCGMHTTGTKICIICPPPLVQSSNFLIDTLISMASSNSSQSL